MDEAKLSLGYYESSVDSFAIIVQEIQIINKNECQRQVKGSRRRGNCVPSQKKLTLRVVS